MDLGFCEHELDEQETFFIFLLPGQGSGTKAVLELSSFSECREGLRTINGSKRVGNAMIFLFLMEVIRVPDPKKENTVYL